MSNAMTVSLEQLGKVLEAAELKVTDALTLHLSYDDSWIEVVVRDEKGNVMWDTEGKVATNILPIKIRRDT